MFNFLKRKNTFCFDFDSTIFPEETLEKMAEKIIKGKNLTQKAQKKVRENIEKITNMGLDGLLSFSESLEQRLKQLLPFDKEILNTYVEESKNKISRKITKLLENLDKSKHEVLIISGGFTEMINPVLSDYVKDVKDKVFANNFIFKGNKVINYNKENLSAQNDSKIKIFQDLKNKNKLSGKIIMIGDGMTDYNVYKNGDADEFVGCGFYAEREKVKNLVVPASGMAKNYFTDIDAFCDFITKKADENILHAMKDNILKFYKKSKQIFRNLFSKT